MPLQARGDPWQLEYVESGRDLDPGALRVRVWASKTFSDRQIDELRNLFNAWRLLGAHYAFGDGHRTNYVISFKMQPEPGRPTLDAVLDMRGGNELAVSVLLWSLDGARHMGLPIARVRVGDG